MGQTPRGGYPYLIMLCNITQNSMGQTPGGYPARSSWGVPCRGVPCQGVPCGGYPAGGGTLPGGTLLGGTPRGYPAGGVHCQGGTLPGYPSSQVRTGGTLPVSPGRAPPSRVLPQPGQDGGGYPGRTTEGVLNTRRAVCLLRSRRRTFLFCTFFGGGQGSSLAEGYFYTDVPVYLTYPLDKVAASVREKVKEGVF